MFRLSAALLAALSLGWTAPVAAQDAAPVDPAAPQGDTYLPSFFEQYAPRTALDMVERIPGFDIDSGDGGRGLGAADTNVLVNGDRLAGKSNGPRDQLRRISADSVVRIEIVEGASLDLPGLTGQVANLIVEVGGLTGQFEYEAEYRPATDRLYAGRFRASISGAAGDVSYTLAAANRGFRGGAYGPVFVTGPDGEPIETYDFANAPGSDNQELNGSLRWNGPGRWSAGLDVTLADRFYQGFETELGTPVAGPVRDYSRTDRSDGWNYEIGLDATAPLAGGSLKLIALERYSANDYRDDVREILLDGSPETGGRYAARNDEGERILRGEYSRALWGADWQLSGEAAFNRLDREAFLLAIDPSGELVEEDFAGGPDAVREDRYEAILSSGFALAGNLDVQLTGGGEYSALSQSGTAVAAREFWRPKGSASLSWQPGGGLDVSLKVARTVGQLEFGDFLAKVFLDSDNENVGNADLVPPQSWETDLELVKDLGGWGSATLKLFDRRIEDLVEIVPVGAGQSPGNIATARRYGLDFDAAVDLARAGLKGVRVDLSVELQESGLDDPLTLAPRSFSNIEYRQLFAAIRHDIPRSDWAWGANAFHSERGRSFRLTETSIDNEGPVFLNLFVEHKDLLGMTVELRAENLLGADSLFQRTVYDGFRTDAPVLFAERADLVFGRIFKLEIEGSF